MVRDNTGKIIFAYANHQTQVPETMPKLLLCSLAWWFLNNDSRPVWAETDSLLLTNCMKKVWKTSWKLASIVDDNQKLVEKS